MVVYFSSGSFFQSIKADQFGGSEFRLVSEKLYFGIRPQLLPIIGRKGFILRFRNGTPAHYGVA